MTPEVKAIFDKWTSMDCFIFAKRYPDQWIESARKDIPNLIAWLGTEEEQHAAWRKRAEEAELAQAAKIDPVAWLTSYADEKDRIGQENEAATGATGPGTVANIMAHEAAIIRAAADTLEAAMKGTN